MKHLKKKCVAYDKKWRQFYTFTPSVSNYKACKILLRILRI